MEYVIGIDSGGTNYRLKAATLNGKELASFVGKPANHYSLEKEELYTRINSGIDSLLAEFNGKREDAKFILCGTTGVDSDEDALLLNEIYSNIPGFQCPVKVINDAELAHYTVTGGSGVLVISGTGAIAYAKDRTGRTARAGGWLFTIMGDEGSGAWVSRSALRYLGRYYDGAIRRDNLISSIEKELDLHSRNDLNLLAKKMGTKPWHTPNIGYIVDQAAEKGEVAAIKLLRDAAYEVFHIVEDVVAILELDHYEPDFNLGIWGSNILKSKIMQSYFTTLVKNEYPKANIILPEKESIDGAVELALKLCDSEKKNTVCVS